MRKAIQVHILLIAGLFYSSVHAQLVWAPLTAPPTTMEVLEFDHSGTLYTLGGGSPMSVLYSSDDAATWQIAAGDGLPNGAFAFDKALHITGTGTILVHAFTSGPFVYRSTDGGNSFIQLDAANGLPPNISFNGFISVNTGEVFAYGQEIYRSDDDGLNWSQVSAQGFALLKATSDGRLFGVSGMSYKFSDDLGQSWSNIDPVGVSVGNVSSIAVGKDTVLYAAGDEDLVIASTDLGSTWSIANVDITQGDPFTHIAAVNNSSQLVAARPFSVFITQDGGALWSQEEMGLTFNFNVSGIRTSPLGEFYIYFLQSLYKLTFPTSVQEVGEQVGVQVFPNPSAGHITVSLDLERSMEVEVELLDLLGRRVSGMFSARMGAGKQHFNWSNELALKGEYIIRTTIGNRSYHQIVIFE